MMLEGATIQTPFLADLVTLADPTSPFSFLNYLKETGRLYSFYIRENFYPLRAEYNDYCRWAAEQLTAVRFGTQVVERRARRATTLRRHAPTAGDDATAPARSCSAPAPRRRPGRRCDGLGGPSSTTPTTCAHRDELRAGGAITLVGSGQSAAEIYHDLLDDIDARLPAELGHPLAAVLPAGVHQAHAGDDLAGVHRLLPRAARRMRDAAAAASRRSLYKGIDGDLINESSTCSTRRALDGPVPTTLLTNTELRRRDVGRRAAYTLTCATRSRSEVYETPTERWSSPPATPPQVPTFLEPVRDRLALGRRTAASTSPATTRSTAPGRVFVQNAEVHTHGFTSPDLGMGAYRNSSIIARALGRESYPVEQPIAFQEFGVSTASRRDGVDGADEHRDPSRSTRPTGRRRSLHALGHPPQGRRSG